MGACKVLDIQFEFQGAADHIYPVLLLNESDAVLVDCGYPGFMGLIESAMKRHGVSAADLTKIVLTHQDDDHMGAASEFVGKYPHIQIAASAVEAPYISGAKKNLRLDTDDVVEWCRKKVLDEGCNIYKRGKNWYCEIDNIKITINSYSYTIITAHMIKYI